MTEAPPNARARAHARDTTVGPENPRTRAEAREAGGIVIRGIRIPGPPSTGSRVAHEGRRVPLVLVDVERAGLRMVFAVARLRGGTLDVRPPRGPDGTGAGIWVPARERERLGAAILAAVDGDPEARAVLRPFV